MSNLTVFGRNMIPNWKDSCVSAGLGNSGDSPILGASLVPIKSSVPQLTRAVSFYPKEEASGAQREKDRGPSPCVS